jgi:hypothetical protein
MADGNVTNFNVERVKRGIGPVAIAETADSAGTGGGDGDPPDMSEIGGRLSKLEGAYDALKVVRPMTLVVISLVLAVMIGGFAFVGTQLASVGGQVGRLDAKIDANAQRLETKIDASTAKLNDKLDAIPQRLAEEFRAMRAEMSAQTSAIANAVTAARQTPPQVLLVPAQPATPAKP